MKQVNARWTIYLTTWTLFAVAGLILRFGVPREARPRHRAAVLRRSGLHDRWLCRAQVAPLHRGPRGTADERETMSQQEDERETARVEAFSDGLAVATRGVDVSELPDWANAAKRRAKEEGRNRVVLCGGETFISVPQPGRSFDPPATPSPRRPATTASAVG